jgi:hypothetical protein
MAAKQLLALLELAEAKGTALEAGEVEFAQSKLDGVPDEDLALLVNQFVLGCGNDSAPVICMGTEEAFLPKRKDGSRDRDGIALGSYAWAVAWLTDSSPQILSAIDGANRLHFEEGVFHRHPYDVDQSWKRHGGGTWRSLAKVMASAHGHTDYRSLLDQPRSERLGDLTYLIERSALPAIRAPQGAPPTPARTDFLQFLVRSFGEARVLLLYGSSGPSAGEQWHKANEDIRDAFLGTSDPDGHVTRVGSSNLAWYDARGRRVILSAALGGGVIGLGDRYRNEVGNLIRDALTN